MDFQIYVISHLRSQNVQKMQDIIGLPLIWVVAPDDVEAYQKAGAGIVIVGGTLIESRNAALEHAFAQNKICVQVSDDLKKVETLDFTTKKKHEALFPFVLGQMLAKAARYPFKLFGAPPTANAFFVHKPESLNTFIIGDLLIVKPSDVRFDNNLSLKEDYDFTASHIKRYGGTMRFDEFMFTFQHYSNAGGAVSYRTEEREKQAVDYLMSKHKGMFRLNPRRKNEVILRVPKSK